MLRPLIINKPMQRQADTYPLAGLATQTARWILWERGSRWVSIVRARMNADRRFDPLERALLTVTSCGECRTTLDRFPSSFVTLEITQDDFIECLGLAVHIAKEFQDARVSVVSSCDDGPSAWHLRELAFREAGVVTVAQNIWNIDRILSCAQNHLENVPIIEMPLDARLWAELPWSESFEENA